MPRSSSRCLRRSFTQADSPDSQACVKDLRKHLLDERGIDRRAVYATGYWRAR